MMMATERQHPRVQQAVRVLIVDDHPIVREGYARLISAQPDLDVCGEASDSTEALQLVDSQLPDVVIVDITLRSGTGIELCKQIRDRSPHVRLLVCSIHDESLYADRALRAGAMGYISKEQPASEVLEAIRRVASGRIALSPRMTERLLSRAVGAEQPVEQSPIDRLSDRELEVFELIGQGQTTHQIANKLHLSPKTVESYRENLKKKLELKSGTELTRHAVQWVLEKS
jgi:DNA-binding NarL/FixJ family response regulator